MRTIGSEISPERYGIAVVMLALVAPVFAVAGAVFGLAFPIGMTLALVLALVIAAFVAHRLPRDWDGMRATHAVSCLLWLLLAVLAIVRMVGVARFMVDPELTQASAYWFDEFYLRHSCYSAYWQAAELAREGVANLYDTAQYTGSVGPFKLDEFNYMPQFLLLPDLGLALGGDFFTLRSLWFSIQAALVFGAIWAMGRWIGGSVGRRVILLIPAVLIASPTMVTLQVGNFQLGAIALSVFAMILFERKRPALGGALLGFAVFKLFPGLLGIYLLAARRWAAAAWTLAFSALYSVIAFAVLGLKPFQAFLNYQVPRITSGDTWAFLEIEGLEWVSALNDSVPGLVLKLHILGVPGMDRAMMGIVAWLWTAFVVVLAILAARRSSVMSRLERANVWIALLALASFRSPFLPDHSGLFAPLLLWSLIAAATLLTPRKLVLLALAWLALGAVLPVSGTPLNDVATRIALGTGIQLLAIGMCVWVVVRNPSAQSNQKTDPLRAKSLLRDDSRNSVKLPAPATFSPLNETAHP